MKGRKNNYTKPVITIMFLRPGTDFLTASPGTDNFGEIPDDWWEDLE